MGLDSVELVMETEKFFRIRIPDVQTEKISTVQHMVDVVAQLLNIISEERKLQDEMLLRIIASIRKIRGDHAAISSKEPVSKYLEVENKEQWGEFQQLLELEVPKPYTKPLKRNRFHKLFSIVTLQPDYDWQAITLEQFTDAICMYNFRSLIEVEKISSKYEVYIGVGGITIDKMGVDCYEIAPGKSFTSDLGID